ncbi:MAG: hypothetical protein AAB330_01880, partial [Bacteroidota bacterium]
MLQFFKRLFGSKHERDAKIIRPFIGEINKHVPGLSSLSDEQLRGKSDEFRARIKEHTKDIEAEIVSAKESLSQELPYE